MIPVPLVGFKSISDRLRLQKEQSESHIARVELIGNEVEEIRAVQANTLSRLQQLKRKHAELTHRVLQVNSHYISNISHKFLIKMSLYNSSRGNYQCISSLR